MKVTMAGMALTLGLLAVPALADSTGNAAYIAQVGNTNWAAQVQEGIGNHVLATQRGHDNRANQTQYGSSNESLLLQQGNGNDASTLQIGTANRADIAQYGRSGAVVEQMGNGGSVEIVGRNTAGIKVQQWGSQSIRIVSNR